MFFTKNISSGNSKWFIWHDSRKEVVLQIGGIKESQEMPEYLVTNSIYPELEIIKDVGAAITDAYQNVLGGKVIFRYVSDIIALK